MAHGLGPVLKLFLDQQSSGRGTETKVTQGGVSARRKTGLVGLEFSGWVGWTRKAGGGLLFLLNKAFGPHLPRKKPQAWGFDGFGHEWCPVRNGL